jgi:hypothetical protein
MPRTGRPRKSKIEQQTMIARVYLNEKTFEEFLQIAAERNISLSALFKLALYEYKKREESEHQQDSNVAA